MKTNDIWNIDLWPWNLENKVNELPTWSICHFLSSQNRIQIGINLVLKYEFGAIRDGNNIVDTDG